MKIKKLEPERRLPFHPSRGKRAEASNVLQPVSICRETRIGSEAAEIHSAESESKKEATNMFRKMMILMAMSALMVCAACNSILDPTPTPSRDRSGVQDEARGALGLWRQPDLIVVKRTSGPGLPLRILVKNQGAVRCGSSYTKVVCLGSSGYKTVEIPTRALYGFLEVGVSEVWLTVATAGAYIDDWSITATVDSRNQLGESNELNNVRTL